MADARIYIKQNGVSGIQKFLRGKLERTKDVKIRFGIIGESGTGKSAFINAIRGQPISIYLFRHMTTFGIFRRMRYTLEHFQI